MSSRTSKPLAIVALLLLAVSGVGIALVLPLGGGFQELATLNQASVISEHGLGEAGARPPLAAVVVGLIDRLLPDDRMAHERPSVRLPYERAVVIHGEADAPDRLPASLHPFHLPRAFRLLGVLLGLFTAGVLFAHVGRLAGGRPVASALAVSSLVLLPGFMVSFATPSGLPLVVALGTLAWVLLLGRLPTFRRSALAGLLLGVAFLADFVALVPLVGSLCLIATSWLPRRERLQRLAILIACPLLLGGGWWLMGRLSHSETGIPIGIIEHQGVYRSVPLTLAEAAHFVGSAFDAFTGSLADGRVTPGELWKTAARLILPVSLLLSVFLLLRRGNEPPARRAAWLLLSAFIACCVALCVSGWNRVEPDVRLLHLLDLPAAAVLACGVRELFQTRALRFMASTAVLSALGGLLLLHGSLIPRFHPTFRAGDVPGAVLRLDLGHVSARTALEHGLEQTFNGLARPHSDLRMVVGLPGDAPGIRIRLSDLDPTRSHLLSVRLAPPVPGFRLGTMTHVSLVAGGRKLTGMLSSHGRQGHWVHAALPTAEPASRSLMLEVRGIGEMIGISQVLVRRVPFDAGQARIEGDRVQVPIFLRDQDLWGFFRARLVSGASFESASVDVTMGEGRRGLLEFPVPAPDAGDLKLVVEMPPVVVADLKAVVCASPEALRSGVLRIASDLGGSVSAPGCLVLKLEPEQHSQRVVFEVREDQAPSGDLEFSFVDHEGRVLPKNFFTFDGGADALSRRPLKIRFTGDRSVRLDRIIARRKPEWRWPLEMVR